MQLIFGLRTIIGFSLWLREVGLRLPQIQILLKVIDLVILRNAVLYNGVL